MNRVIAFFISNNDKNLNSFNKAKNFFKQLSVEFNFLYKELKVSNIFVSIIYQNNLIVYESEEFISFIVSSVDINNALQDRNVKVQITKNNIIVENDWAGSIPCFYSIRGHISLSNIEPVVVLDSDSKTSDFSYENIYCYLRLSHFIWDETAYKHINVLTPDTKLLIDLKIAKY